MKKSFILYTDAFEMLQHLSDEQLGRLTRMLFEYQISGAIPDVSDPLFFPFGFIRASLDRDNKKWEQRAERARINGNKGGRPKENPEQKEEAQKTQSVISEPTKPVNVNVNVNDNVSVSVNDSVNFNGAKAPKQKKNKEVLFRDSPYFDNPVLFMDEWSATKTAEQYPQIDPLVLYESIKLTTDATDKYRYANWMAAAQNWAKRDPKQYFARTGIEQFSRGTQELHRRNETLSQLAFDPITGRPWDE